MARLTNSIREAIGEKLIKRAFQTKAQEAVKDAAAFAIKVYEDALRDDLPTIRTLKEGWLPTDNDIKVQFGAEVIAIKFNGQWDDYSLDSRLKMAGAEVLDKSHFPFPSRKKGTVVKIYSATDPLAEEFDKMKSRYAAVIEEIRKAYADAMRAMNQVSSVKKLMEVWPEVTVIAMDYMEAGERKAILPAVPRAELNKALGLPPSPDEELEHAE